MDIQLVLESESQGRKIGRLGEGRFQKWSIGSESSFFASAHSGGRDRCTVRPVQFERPGSLHGCVEWKTRRTNPCNSDGTAEELLNGQPALRDFLQRSFVSSYRHRSEPAAAVGRQVQ